MTLVTDTVLHRLHDHGVTVATVAVNRQAKARLAAGALWQDTRLVFTKSVRPIHKAGIEGVWTPREPRHRGSSRSCPIGWPRAQIALLAGHSGSRTTEAICRHNLRPVSPAGAGMMDKIFI